MITLITGTPGAGKTAWTVQELTRLPAQRKIYVHGIPDLKIAHEPIYCRSDLCDLCKSQEPALLEQGYYVEDWPQWATQGSLIVIDEVQRIWRPAPAGKELPDSISRLETHRHSGLDFWLISQGPHLFHSNIRLLIGRHIHLVATWRGRSEYEFPECRQDVTRRSDAIVRPYALPTKVFGLYKSASLHTVQKRRSPLAVFIFLIVVVITALMSFRFYVQFTERNQAQALPVEPAKNQYPNRVNIPDPMPPSPPIATNSSQLDLPDLASFPDFMPKIPGVAESAPAYKDIIKVTTAPMLSGCAAGPGWCKCYTQQGTIYQTTSEGCYDYIKNRRFNPYKRDKDQNPVTHIAQN